MASYKKNSKNNKSSKNTKKNTLPSGSHQLTNRAKLKRQLQQQNRIKMLKYPDNIYQKMELNALFQFIMNMTFTIFRYGIPIMDMNLTAAIKNMISKRVKLDAAAEFKGFQFRHTATFFPSGTKWREKPGSGRKFDSKSIYRLWLRPSCGDGCYSETATELQSAQAA